MEGVKGRKTHPIQALSNIGDSQWGISGLGGYTSRSTYLIIRNSFFFPVLINISNVYIWFESLLVLMLGEFLTDFRQMTETRLFPDLLLISIKTSPLKISTSGFRFSIGWGWWKGTRTRPS